MAKTIGYSITLSARTNNASGTVTPIALAVFRLITSSNLVGCSTGMSAGLTPRKSLTSCWASRIPPAEPGALVMWPLEAAVGAADAAP